MTRFRRSRRALLLAGASSALLASLPGCQPLPPPLTRILRRKNLNLDYTAAEQKELSDLIFGYLTREIIDAHMLEVDHIDNLFTDHRTYLYEIEKKLIRDGHIKYVPLPFWEPVNDIPEGWRKIHASFERLVLAPHNASPRKARPQIPAELRPENICAANLATARDVAIKVGRSAWSAPASYHFNSHAALAGPFVQMSSAASAVIFWGYHGLLVDIYDKWLTCKWPGRNRKTVVGRSGDGHLELFTVTSDNRLWCAWQRLKNNHRSETDKIMDVVDVTFVHWSHWFEVPNLDIADVTVATDHAGKLVLLAKAKGSGTAFDRLLLARQNGAGWTPWVALTLQTSEIRDFAVAMNADNTLEILVIRQTSPGAYVVSAKTESAPQSNSFGSWVDITGPGPFHRLSTGRYRAGPMEFPHLVVSSSPADPVTPAQPGWLLHLWKAGGGWTQRALADEAFSAVQIAANADGRPEIFAIRDSDKRVYRKSVASAAYSIGSDASWNDWERLGSAAIAFRNLAVGQHQDGKLDVFATDSSGKVHHVRQGAPNGAWSNWEEIPRLPIMGTADEPMAARDYTNSVKLFVHAQDNFTYMAEQVSPNAGSWIGWTNI